jgi:hypothetical protein
VGGGVSDFTQNKAILINLRSITILQNKKIQAVADISRQNRKLSSIISQTTNNGKRYLLFLADFFIEKRHQAGRRITRMKAAYGLDG